ncbi:MAG TPA: mucoidy inhibitor MuiA family protein [Panacibacter sp.]|nr:mucoidy inhibitor MuiA family protein [Panacibacter sp.]HNP45755.1 mucoidy inhibitor MuiA family protein [Panacibacter sp.]
MKTRNILIVVFLLSFTALYAKEVSNITQADLKSVTVYRSGAELLHNASAVLKQGNNELVIENLGNTIDINSIQIKAPSTVTILGVEFSNNYLISSEKTPKLQLLQDSLDKISDQIAKINLSLTVASDLLDVLKSNRDIKGQQAGLSVAELTKLIDYYKSKSSELQNEIQQLNDKRAKLLLVTENINKQIAEEQKKNVSTAGRLTLQLSAAIGGKADFIVSYIAGNAYWTPYYDIRIENTKSPVKMIYKAKIVQTTGIDWKQVKLSLSTSVPAQWGNAPVMQSWFLGYINPVSVMDNAIRLRGMNTIQSLDGKVAGLNAGSQLNEVVVVGYGDTDSETSGSSADRPKPVYIVNGAVMSEYEFQKIAPSSIKKISKLKASAALAMYGSQAAGGAVVVDLKEGLEDYISIADNALNVSFDIDMPYDVPTNGKEQTATLQNIDVPANYKHYAVPKMDKDPYLLAEIADWEKLNLLPGDANIIVEGTYVGKSFIDPNSTTDTLNLTLGRDRRVVIKREKLADFSSVKFLGANKLQKFTYEITVKNNKNEPVNLLLKDQYPLTTNKEIEVELLESSDAEINKDLGILNWKINLAAGESKKIRFAYSVKYPKDKTLNLN